MSENTAPYMLLFHDSSPSCYAGLSPEQIQQFLTQWNSWYDGLIAEGKLDHGRPLEQERRVVSGARGERVVDGPFAESKESIAGYFLLMVKNIDEATGIAKGCPGLAHGLVVEVRPVADCCHAAKSIGLKSMRETVPV